MAVLVEGPVQKRIGDESSFKLWEASGARRELAAFVARLNKSCVGRPNVRVEDATGAPRKLMDALQAVASACDRFAPEPGEARRYGSPKFRAWHAWLSEAGPSLVAAAIGRASPELSARLGASFGDPTRVDYGTGHELAFVTFLFCAHKLGALTDADVDGGGACRGIFAEYVRTCRIVQKCFGLEPAGSLGVWALDDYQMLPFVFGSAQRCRREGSQDNSPAAWADEETGDVAAGALDDAASCMFLEAVDFVKACTAHAPAPLVTVAPILFNTSMNPWHVINRRVLRLWDEEVLGRKPVVQHLLFGEIFAADWAPPPAEVGGENNEDADAARLARRLAVMEAANKKLREGAPPPPARSRLWNHKAPDSMADVMAVGTRAAEEDDEGDA